MKLSQIIEAEVDPKTGEVHRWVDRDKLLRKYAGDESVFVSFSDVNKLGLNPSSDYDTPIGIYAYPVDYVIERSLTNQRSFNVPFASDRKFIIVFRVRNTDNYWRVNSVQQEWLSTDGMTSEVDQLVRKWVRSIRDAYNRASLLYGSPDTSRNWSLHFWETDLADFRKNISTLVETLKLCTNDWQESSVEPGSNYKWFSSEREAIAKELSAPNTNSSFGYRTFYCRIAKAAMLARDGLQGFPEADRLLANSLRLDDDQLNAVKFLTTVDDFILKKWKAKSFDDLLWRLCRAAGRFLSKKTSHRMD